MKQIDGFELVLDLQFCDKTAFSRTKILKYFIRLCKLLKMQPHGKPIFWKDAHKKGHMQGISAIQLIETSSIAIHEFGRGETAFVNIFSCKKFNQKKAENFTKKFFGAERLKARFLLRK